MAKINHVSLFVKDIEASVAYYLSKGMNVRWKPDEDNVYLTNGGDILALHKGDENKFDHFGVSVDSVDEVHLRRHFAKEMGEGASPVTIHRDGSVGYYTRDPAGFNLEFIWIPEDAHAG